MKESCLDTAAPTARERNQTMRSRQMKAQPFSRTLLLVCLCLISSFGINNMMVGGQNTAALTQGVLEPTRDPLPVGPIKDVQGYVYVVLLHVADEMPDSLTKDFEAACTTFFEQALEMTSPPIHNITVDLLLAQTRRSVTDRRSLGRSPAEALDEHRDLQTDLPALWTLLRVRGEVDTSTGTPPQDLDELLVDVVEQNPQGLLQLLRQIPGEAEIYFGPVDTIEGHDPIYTIQKHLLQLKLPEEAEVYSEPRLSSVVMAAIVICSAVAVGAGTMGVYRTRMKKVGGIEQSVKGTASQDSLASSNGVAAPSLVTEKDSIPSSLLPNQDKGGDNSIAQSMSMAYTDSQHDSTTQGAASIMDSSDVRDMSYTYSLDPGNVDQQTTTSGEGHTSIEDQSTEYSERPNLFSKQVLAPPGKLGISVDTTLVGPVVQKVNQGSAMEGKLSAGDILVAIDDIDVRAMPASAISALMATRAYQERQLTVLSEEEI